MEAGFETSAGSDANPARGLPWLGVAGFLAVGAFLLVDSSSSRHLEVPKGQVFWGVVYVWLGAVWVLRLWRRGAGSSLSPWSATALSLVGYVPGVALLWYSLSGLGQTRVTTCRGKNGASAHCVSGPGAAIPWAVLLLAAALAVTIVTFRRRRRRRRRASLGPLGLPGA